MCMGSFILWLLCGSQEDEPKEFILLLPYMDPGGLSSGH